MASASVDGNLTPAPESDFEFIKPTGRPFKRKRSKDAAQLDGQPPCSSSRKENRESLDVFTCVGVLYYTRLYGRKLKKMYNEFNNVIENGKDAEFTVKVAKTIAAKLNNTAVNNMIDTWEQVENMWQTMVQCYMNSYADVKKASERYMSAVNCFISIWGVKNQVLHHLSNRLDRLLTAITKASDDNELKPFKSKVIQAFSLEDDVSTQMVSQQRALIALTLNLLLVTHRMDPYGKLQKEWALLRAIRKKVKEFLVQLKVDFEKELELARETCGDEISTNNTIKELCMMLRRGMDDYHVILCKGVEFFVASHTGEINVDNNFTNYLVHRIVRREGTPATTFVVLKLLCQRGTGGSFPEDMRTKYALKEHFELRKLMIGFQAQCSLWGRLEAVKFANTLKFDTELWGDVGRMIKEKLLSEKREDFC